MKVDHATGEIAGNVVRNLLNVPLSRSFARFGSWPSFMNRSASSGIHPIKTQNHRALEHRFAVSVAIAQTPQVPEGPGEQRIERIQERNKESPERRQHRKSRAGAGIGMARERTGHSTKKQQHQCRNPEPHAKLELPAIPNNLISQSPKLFENESCNHRQARRTAQSSSSRSRRSRARGRIGHRDRLNRTPSGNAASEELNSRSQRARAAAPAKIAAHSGATTTCLLKLSARRRNIHIVVPSLSRPHRQTTSLSAGTCTEARSRHLRRKFRATSFSASPLLVFHLHQKRLRCLHRRQAQIPVHCTISRVIGMITNSSGINASRNVASRSAE